MEQKLSFEELPNAVTMLAEEVRHLKNLLIEKQEEVIKDPTEKILSVIETAEFLNLRVATIYSKCSRNQLPFMKRSKRLYFSRTELLNYLKEGRRKSKSEIEKEGDCHLSNIKKGLK